VTTTRKPANFTYGLDESPPPFVTLLNGHQHVGVIAINLVYPLLVFRVVGAPIDLVASLISTGMFVLAIATFLQAKRLGPVGSGFLCPATFTATYLGSSLLTAKVGGLSMILGMTIFVGLLEAVVAPLFNRFRAIFPPEVSNSNQ
jgi:NCS2 family nucleobase:cation symporter-2